MNHYKRAHVCFINYLHQVSSVNDKTKRAFAIQYFIQCSHVFYRRWISIATPITIYPAIYFLPDYKPHEINGDMCLIDYCFSTAWSDIQSHSTNAK